MKTFFVWAGLKQHRAHAKIRAFPEMAQKGELGRSVLSGGVEAPSGAVSDGVSERDAGGWCERRARWLDRGQITIQDVVSPKRAVP